MHRGHSHRIFATVSRAILLISNLIVGCCGATSVPAWGFGPPSNVVADVIPDLRKYELRRIGIIALVNRSGTPDAGVRVANFFFQERDAHQRFELTPPLLLDEVTELAFTRTAQAAPEEERPDRLRRFVREWIGRIWPSTSRPSETSQGQTHDRPSRATTAETGGWSRGACSRTEQAVWR